MAKEGHGHGFAPAGFFVHDAVEVVDLPPTLGFGPAVEKVGFVFSQADLVPTVVDQAEVVVGGHDDPVEALEGGEGRFLDIHRGRRDLTGEVLFLEISIPGKKEKLIDGSSGPRSFFDLVLPDDPIGEIL